MKATAFLLSDKIIVETSSKKDEGTWYSSGLLTILALNTSDFELGECVLYHLNQSKEEDISYELIREKWKSLIKKANFKSEKSFFENAKRVGIKQINECLILEPYKTNISQKMFYRIPEATIEIKPFFEKTELGKQVRNSWDKCSFV